MTALAVKANSYTSSLRELLRGLISDALLAQLPERLISGLSLDSRRVEPHSVFLALPGLRHHGIDYAAQAISNGASVVLWQPDATHTTTAISGAPVIAVPQLTVLLGKLADRFYAQPSAALKIAAVTGTNGKTTTAYLIAGAAEYCGLTAGYSGTIGYGRITTLQTSTHTTPDVVSVHQQLHELRASGAQVVSMEVSSHALHQSRIDAVRIDTAVFTNLSRDHLDYHGDMQAYGEAKALLFQIGGLRHQVINADDAFGRELLRRTASAALTTAYSCAHRSSAARSLHAAVQLHEAGLQLNIGGSFGEAVLQSKLLGQFNAENLLAALAVLLGWDISLPQAVQALQQVAAPPGRMELLRNASKRAVIDYAHTPDALEKALTVLKRHCHGKLICVFGCGGDRDAGKRAPMGAIAARLADQVILTDDNPRSEDPGQIITAIQSGMQNFPVIIQRDRALAIEQALQTAQAEDMVLIAGKGHEDYQLIGNETRHFSDREVVQSCLRRSA
jgi:UDP-N-acetylmuramoyl-L-alanyl-D-glutamate--2,6-diaminopimelate ligase